jgi:hypothetical protein
MIPLIVAGGIFVNIEKTAARAVVAYLDMAWAAC